MIMWYPGVSEGSQTEHSWVLVIYQDSTKLGLKGVGWLGYKFNDMMFVPIYFGLNM